MHSTRIYVTTCVAYSREPPYTICIHNSLHVTSESGITFVIRWILHFLREPDPSLPLSLLCFFYVKTASFTLCFTKKFACTPLFMTFSVGAFCKQLKYDLF